MTVERMDHVGVVVDDLDAAIAFFAALGLESRGRGSVEGDWVDRIIGLHGSEVDFAMVGPPGGGAALELIRFRSPPSEDGDAAGAANHRGLRHLCFAVDDIEATVAALRDHGGELVGEIADAGGFLLCYLRGPEGIIVELAQATG